MVQFTTLITSFLIGGVISASVPLKNFNVVNYCDNYPVFSKTSPRSSITATSVELVNGKWHVSFKVTIDDFKGLGLRALKSVEQTAPNTATHFAGNPTVSAQKTRQGNVIELSSSLTVTNPMHQGEFLCAPDISILFNFKKGTYGTLHVGSGCSSGDVSPRICWNPTQKFVNLIFAENPNENGNNSHHLKLTKMLTSLQIILLRNFPLDFLLVMMPPIIKVAVVSLRG